MKKVTCPDGPIHDVSWAPNSQHFIVISGFMPAYSIMYKNDSTPYFEFGRHHRNTIRFSPFSIKSFTASKLPLDDSSHKLVIF